MGTRALIVAAGLALPWAASAARPDAWSVPVSVRKLDNGLTVVISEDHTSPTFGLSVVYEVGMRREPQGRTGFAHLFEHLMFEGTPNAPAGVFDRVIQGGGGINNGSTRSDFTNYIASAPVSALEPILWLEADRMKALDFDPANLKNQQDVVKEEVRVNVKNQPYGVFYWTDLNDLAFDKWENGHDGYGSFQDLENAQLDDVRAFHRDYYGPNNAVIALAGDLDPEATFALVEKHFGGVPRRETPAPADFSEPLNTEPRSLSQTDPLARVPGLAIGWKMPPRGSPDHMPMAVLAELLAAGEASRLYLGLVKKRELLLRVNGGVNWPLGGFLDYDGPALLTLFALYKPTATPETVLAAIDEEVARIVKEGVEPSALQRVKTQMLSGWYGGGFHGGLEGFMWRADTLAKTQALWGDANVVNQVPGWIEAVTSADLQRVAAKYLVAGNRSVIDRTPAPAKTAAEGVTP